MTDDQLILLAVLPIFRAPTEGDRAPSSRTDRPGGGSMELTRRCLLRWGIMLGGGAALIPTGCSSAVAEAFFEAVSMQAHRMRHGSGRLRSGKEEARHG